MASLSRRRAEVHDVGKISGFKGGTPPWEAQGWVEYTVLYDGRELLFARRVKNLPTLEETKKALGYLEK